MPVLSRASVLASALLAILPGSAIAAPSAPASTGYFDGQRWVDVERLAEPPLASGRKRIRLSHDTGAQVIAEIDATAIVRVSSADDEAALAARGVRLLRPVLPGRGLWLAEDSTGGDGLDVAMRISGAVPNLYLRMRAKGEEYTPSDPRFGGQWYFQNIGMPEAWGITRGDAKTTVVVVDTGCDLEHPDLAAKMDAGRDVVDQDDDPSYVASDNGAAHGTECAGLVAAATDNDEGIAGGCPECRLRCVRMLSDEPMPLSADVDAFQFAIDAQADVISNSWGFVEAMPVPGPLSEAIQEAATNGRGGLGAIVVFAAGNDDRELGDDELEAVPGVLCVGAINNFDDATPFTNRGNAIDLVAPTGTLTTDISGSAGSDPTDYTSLFGGTSSACPVVAGIAGLLVSAAPERTGAELTELLIRTTRPAPFAVPDEAGHDDLFGYGIVDPVAALTEVTDMGGQGGAGGGAGDGAGGSGASSTATASSAGGGEDGAAGESDDGCGCAVVGRERGVGPASIAWSQVFVLVAALSLRRRRRSPHA